MTAVNDLSVMPREWLDALEMQPGHSLSMKEYKPVVAVTFTQEPLRGFGGEVLLTVRHPVTNLTHPNALSVPTRRTGTPELDRQHWLDGQAEALVREKLNWRIAGARVQNLMTWQGESVIRQQDGEPVTERLTMINLYVPLASATRIPWRTNEYSWAGFVPEKDAEEIIETRDASRLGLTSEPVVYGLCTQSTLRMLRETR